VNRCVMVLGMHRTGTSTVAGVLHHLGVSMGNRLMPPTDDNPKGYYEDEDFYELNQKFVDSWKAENVFDPTPDILEQYKILLGGRSIHEIWGMKDPRLCVMAKHIVSFISDLRMILVDRHADDCISSMVKRYAVSPLEGAQIRKRFLDNRSRLVDGFIGPVENVRYESLLCEPRKVIEKIVRFAFYEMEKPSDETIEKAMEFIDPKLNREGEIRKESKREK
jgi:hypothetical protein